MHQECKMSSKNGLLLTGILVIAILLTGACSAGFILGRTLNIGPESAGILPVEQAEAPSAQAAGSADPQDQDKLFEPFWQAWDIVHEQFVDQPVDDEALMQGAIQGMLESLGDEHTSYMDPFTYEQSTSHLQGQYEGIGATVDTTSEYLTIISPMPDSPAEKAGLKAGDQVVAVDGIDMTGMEGELVRRKVIGPAGTQVTLTIKRESVEDPFDVVVTRAKIIMHSVESEMLDNNIAYIRLNTFGEDTSKDLESALRDLMAQKPAALILDLRNNGGGYLTTAVDVTSQFVADGVALFEDYGNGQRQTYKVKGGGLATDIPMVVLINEGSASASEIVAGAIQDHERGKLIGVTSFGKGTVQIVSQLMDDQGAVRVTIARWLTPGERTIHELGLSPDLEIELTEADIEAERDPQLDTAVKYLLGMQK
jgi:carboxyl-terminal processing protease